ncbi:hypothetical protein NEIG_01831 [Nematocida sp. ERTm5]|nr:hypothetical protein NEIRO02_1469 [Nematocida sp. AWRm79]KAI5184035.1 hypothetical protein NEIRO03_1502 [Nematocida sp. AWRm78]OAG33346.1 hypothetical protein NEIG_01831 [Nematocida sp. ERTm5]
MPLDKNMPKTEEIEESPFFYLDEIQANFYKLFSLFYSGIGIIQRDSPAKNEKPDQDAILRLENNIKEIIGQFITTREKLEERILKIEKEKPSFDSLENLLEKTRELDKIMQNKVKVLEEELPLFREAVEEIIEEIDQI